MNPIWGGWSRQNDQLPKIHKNLENRFFDSNKNLLFTLPWREGGRPSMGGRGERSRELEKGGGEEEEGVQKWERIGKCVFDDVG